MEPQAAMLRSLNLQGYSVSDTALFAENTMVYVMETDSFSDLQEILAKWCRPSSTKFDVGKTEIIRIGAPEYRQYLIENQKLNTNDIEIPKDIHISKECESVCILGARIGNKVDAHAIWSPVLEKIDSALERWDCTHLTLEQRCHIIQVTIGSTTQYLTQINGMPKSVEKELIATQREFMWGGTKPSVVQREMLVAPIDKGDKKMLDPEARNDTIRLMRLKAYLNLDPVTRAAWAYVADRQIQRYDKQSSNVEELSYVNMFLQCFCPSLCKTRNKKRLPRAIKEMISVPLQLLCRNLV
jgi:hypothetical protein